MNELSIIIKALLSKNSTADIMFLPDRLTKAAYCVKIRTVVRTNFGGVAMQRKTNKEDTSVKILNTAFECLSANGYANVSMRDIADKAGVALSQLAYYYKNKEKLFSEVINMMMDQYLSEIEATLKTASNATSALSSAHMQQSVLYSLQKKKKKLLLKDSSSRNSEDQSKASSSASLSIRKTAMAAASALTYARLRRKLLS